mmetsp:Transcript_31348/g.78677  ORF Transcript_31348/g.78677 Transcript_31348/m.78677 type:complete len:99 (+) Transcript_31348:544-840(+)
MTGHSNGVHFKPLAPIHPAERTPCDIHQEGRRCHFTPPPRMDDLETLGTPFPLPLPSWLGVCMMGRMVHVLHLLPAVCSWLLASAAASRNLVLMGRCK